MPIHQPPAAGEALHLSYVSFSDTNLLSVVWFGWQQPQQPQLLRNFMISRFNQSLYKKYRKQVKLFGGVSCWRICYQWGLPGLVYNLLYVCHLQGPHQKQMFFFFCFFNLESDKLRFSAVRAQNSSIRELYSLCTVSEGHSTEYW